MRKLPLTFAISLFALVGAHGCSGSKSCVHDGDCGSGENCAYPATNGCGAQGVCKTWDNQCDDPPHPACGCDGKTVFVGCGYPGNPVPVLADGYCATPVGGDCSSQSDCDPTALCAYPIADGCGAKGKCVEPDRTCMAPTKPACSCTGETIEISCTFGAGNAVARVASMGACDGGAPIDASSDVASDAATDATNDAASE
jgi:hypothetical protein